MRRFDNKASRFSNRVLLTHAAAGLPEGLAVRAQAGKPTEILLYDEIGLWGVTAKDFTMAQREAGDGPLKVRINSPGGEVFDGLAIYNALKQHPSEVTVVIDGIAASAASFLAMAGSKVEMAENAFVMIHNSQGLAYGDRNTMAELMAIMTKLDGQLASIYARRTGTPVDGWAAAMDAETWYTSSEALEAKLVDEVLTGETPRAMAVVKPGAFERAPEAVTNGPSADPAKLLADATAARRRLLRLVEAEASA